MHMISQAIIGLEVCLHGLEAIKGIFLMYLWIFFLLSE